MYPIGRTCCCAVALLVTLGSRVQSGHQTGIKGAVVAFLYFQQRESQKNENGARKAESEK